MIRQPVEELDAVDRARPGRRRPAGSGLRGLRGVQELLLVPLVEHAHSIGGLAGGDDRAAVQDHGAVAHVDDLLGGVRDEDDRAPFLLEVADLVDALALEGLVAHRQDLVDEEDVRVRVHGHGEGEADVHARGVELHLGVEEVPDPREVDDGVELPVDLPLGQAQDRSVQVDVLPAGQVRVEPGAQLQKRGDASPDVDLPPVGREDAADDLQEGGLARAVGAGQPDRLARVDRERDVLQGPVLLRVEAGAAGVDHPLLERLVLVDREFLGDTVDSDDLGT
jgi:hypothetical protein